MSICVSGYAPVRSRDDYCAYAEWLNCKRPGERINPTDIRLITGVTPQYGAVAETRVVGYRKAVAAAATWNAYTKFDRVQYYNNIQLLRGNPSVYPGLQVFWRNRWQYDGISSCIRSTCSLPAKRRVYNNIMLRRVREITAWFMGSAKTFP